MHRSSVVALVVGLLVLGIPPQANSQQSRGTAEFGFGTLLGAVGGDYYQPNGAALTAFLGARIGMHPPRSQVLGATLSVVGDPGSSDVCHIAPNGGCLPDFPLLFGLGAEGGWTVGASYTSTFRIGAGGYWNMKDDAAGGVGLQGQADVAFAPIVLALRGITLPNFQGHAVFIATLTLVLRWN